MKHICEVSSELGTGKLNTTVVVPEIIIARPPETNKISWYPNILSTVADIKSKGLILART